MGERGGLGAPGGIAGGVYGYGVPLTADLLQRLLAAAPGTTLPSLEPSAAPPPPPQAVPLPFRHADVLGTNLLQRTADVELPALGAAEPAAPEPGASHRSPPTPPSAAPKVVKKKRTPRRRSKPATNVDLTGRVTGRIKGRIGKHRGISRHPTIKGRWEVNVSVKKKLTLEVT